MTEKAQQPRQSNPDLTGTFSIRRLNPFRGMLQIVATADARAISANGIEWEVQVCSQQPTGLWANTPLGERRYFNFGVWRPDSGLDRVPVNPLFDIDGMLQATDSLIKLVKDAVGALPFKPVDRYECWLLDSHSNQPIALLDSCINAFDIDLKLQSGQDDLNHAQWDLAVKNDDTTQTLSSLLLHRSGGIARGHWFERNADGSGIQLANRKLLAKDQFPELILTRQWADQHAQTLAEQWIRNHAPYLLMLHGLSHQTRQELELMAYHRSRTLNQLWRLYPEIIDEKLMEATRVRAAIETTNHA